MSDLIDRDETIKQFCKQDCDCDPKDCPDKTCYEVEIIESVPSVKPTHPTPSNTLGTLDCIDRRLVSYKLTDLVNEFEEILSHIREREENDSVCGLCEYDGAYIGQSGDWCNECPGFDKADCFKLKDKYKKEWLELMNTLPSAQPEKGKWAGKGDSEGFGIFICDNCGKFAMMEYDFCPNCGADMREGDAE